MGFQKITQDDLTTPRPNVEVFTNTDVPTADVVKATFSYDNTLGQIAADATDLIYGGFAPDDDYNSADDLDGYEAWADELISAKSRDEMAYKKSRIDEELRAKETIASATGTQQLLASTLNIAADPITLIPVGGAAYKTYRAGGSVLTGAARTGAVAAAIETGREAYMLNTQDTREWEESAANVAGATFLSGVLGGAAAGLSAREMKALSEKVEEDMKMPEMRSVGAAQAGTTAEQEMVKGLGRTQKVFEKVPDFLKSPVYRGTVSTSKVVRQFTEQMADTSLIKNKNTDFIGSATSVENKIKAYDALKYSFYTDYYKPQWKAYKKRMKDLRKSTGIPQEQRIGSAKSGIMTEREFAEEVTKANRRNDTHIIPEVQDTARGARSVIFDPLKQRMVDTGLLDDFDVEIKTAPSWARRMWDKDKILANADDFKARNAEWLRQKTAKAAEELEQMRVRNAAEIQAKDPDTLARMESLERRAEMDEDDILRLADEITDRITGLPGGRLGYDISLEPKASFKKEPGARGSAKRRAYDIPDEFVEDYLVNDVNAIIESHVRTTAADAELKDTFGHLDFDIIKRLITEDYNSMITRNPSKSKELEKAKRQDISDLQAMWEKLRGFYAQPDDFAAPQHVLERALLGWNYARLLGGMTLSAIPDMGRNIMVHGMTRTMNDGIKAMMTDFKGFKFAAKDVREASVGLDMALSTTARARANMDEWTPITGRVDAATNAITHHMGNLAGMNQWNTAQKTFAGVLTQTRMMRAIKEYGEGKKLTKREIENLASHGIGEDEARLIAKQFAKFGEVRDNVLIPNARSWDDAEMAGLFRAAVRKQVDEIIVTPGMDRPLWMSRPGLRLIGQFRSFAFASMQRVALSGIQQGDAAAINGVMMMIAMGSMTYALKTTLAGRELSDDPRVWMIEGIDRSGITGWLFDANNITEKVTRGRVGINSLVGGPPMSRYASRNAVGAILGPTYGAGLDLFQVIGAASAGDWKDSDTHAMRRLIPYQNVVWLRGIFDEIEEGLKKNGAR